MKKLYFICFLTLLFIGLVILIKTNVLNTIDVSIGEGAYSLHDNSSLTLIKWIGMLGSTIGIITVLFLSMLLFIILQKNWIAAIILFLSVLFANIGNKLFKAIIARERPILSNHIEEGFSFPSGHVMVGLVLFGMIAYYLVKISQSKRGKQAIISGISVLMLVIGFSRLLEGDHFFTDILGGFLIGGLVLIGMIKVDRGVHKKVLARNNVSM